jgi:sterol desaturase/sphingolipid hydroxylase (fatty acid hydroxylase superfamily)
MPVIAHLQAFASQTGIAVLLGVFLAVALVERIAPAEKAQPLGDFLFNAGYALAENWLAFLAAPLFAAAATIIVGALGGGLLALPKAGWGLLWAAPLYIFSVDFMEYAFHRAQHAWPFLWAMHSFHHSDRSVNVTTTSRNYWLEMPIKALFVYPLVAVLLKASPAVLALYGFSAWIRFFAHMNLRISFGRLWWLLSTPQYHRIHHSREAEHLDRNFAAYFPIFDVIFGTAYRPASGEYPATGIEGEAAPTSVVDAAIWPMRRLRRRARPGKNVRPS